MVNQQNVSLEGSEKAYHPITKISTKSAIRKIRKEGITMAVTIPARIVQQAVFWFDREKTTEVIIEMDMEKKTFCIKKALPNEKTTI